MHVCYGSEHGILVKVLTLGEWVSDSFACCWEPFLPAGFPCPVLMCLDISYLAMFVCYSLNAFSFLKGKGGEVDPGEKRGGVGLVSVAGEDAIGM